LAEFPLLKDMVDRQLVEQIAARLIVIHPEFDHASFVASVVTELDTLALKARHQLIAAKLREYLPAHYPSALRILLAALDEERGFAPITNAGLRLMAIPRFIERYGVAHPAVSLDAMPIVTGISSCEFAIRPYITNAPNVTMARLREWASSDDEDLRRLASEGSRPRLPWGAQLVAFVADPTPTLALLEHLKDDPSLYVRRSVANHLNDIGKDHPGLLLERMEAWSADASEERRWLINHALRSLVKAGNQQALAILGYGPAAVALEKLTLSPMTLDFGEELKFSFVLRNMGGAAQDLMVDFVMHFRKANGKTAPKVFKLKKMRLAQDERAQFDKRFAIRPISTRKYYPGRQRLEIQVNGTVLGGADFELVMQ
jgi:3-methyladenine DNA glycosylase AlkC